MKLKKIVSLALAGILAVSMLAGCAEGTKPVEQPTTNVVSDSSVLSVINTAVAGNKAGVSFTADKDFTNALKKAVTENGTTADDVKTALATELELGSSYTFTANALNPHDSLSAGKTTNTGLEVYAFSGEKETALSAASKVASQVYTVVNGLTTAATDQTNTTKLVEYTYSDANVAVVELAVNGTNYYVVAVQLTCVAERAA